jgi:Tfp pilus assembly protein PilO
MKPTTEKRRLLIGLIFVVALLLYASYVYCLQPLGRAVGTLSRQVHEVTAQVRQLEQLVAQAPALQQEHAQLPAAVEQLREGLPSEDELPLVIERVSGLANQTGVRILSIFPQRSESHENSPSASAPLASTPYHAVAIEIEALSGFHQLGMFLNHVESSDQPMEVKQLRISPSERELRRHAVTLTLLTYVTIPYDATAPNT